MGKDNDYSPVYIHGTGSGNLPLLKKTGFIFHSMQDLVTKYHASPLIAAVDNGVTGIYSHNGSQQAFGELSSTNYSIDSIMYYASAAWCEPSQHYRDNISSIIDGLCENKFSIILLETVKILQARQMGYLENLPALELSTIEKKLQQTREQIVKTWILFYVVARYIKKPKIFNPVRMSN